MKRMKRLYNITLILLLLLFASAGASAQIRGVITDSLTHEPLMYITVQYEGKGVGGISNADGEYQVETRKGWNELTFSAIGYITKKVKFAPGTKVLNVALAPADVMLSEVVVKPKKEKYSRKNNPAVEFMKKVIEHKKALKLEENDFYQYQKYEKMKMSINDVTPEKMEKGIYKKFSFFKDQVEVSPKTNKMILPISIKETASRTIYRKSPKSEKTIIEGMNSNGIEEFFNTGDMLGTILTDVFSDVNIYDDDIRLLQRRFVSPIGSGGSVAQDQQDDSAHLHQGDGFQNHLPKKSQEREDHHRGYELQRHRGVLQHGRYVRYYPYRCLFRRQHLRR